VSANVSHILTPTPIIDSASEALALRACQTIGVGESKYGS